MGWLFPIIMNLRKEFSNESYESVCSTVWDWWSIIMNTDESVWSIMKYHTLLMQQNINNDKETLQKWWGNKNQEARQF